MISPLLPAPFPGKTEYKNPRTCLLDFNLKVSAILLNFFQVTSQYYWCPHARALSLWAWWVLLGFLMEAADIPWLCVKSPDAHQFPTKRTLLLMILTIVPSRGMYSSFHSIAKTLHLFFGWFFFKWEGSCCLAATGLKLPGCLVLLFFPYLSLLLIFCFLHRGLRYCPWYVAAEVFFISCSVTLLKHNLPALPAVPTPASSKVHQGTCPRGEAPVLTPAQWRAAGSPCCHLSKRLHPPPSGALAGSMPLSL